jgi:hypothetical protein
MNELQAQFHRDGVVFIADALDHHTLKLAEEAFQWTFTHPGPGAGAVLLGTPGTFYQDQANPDAFAFYRELLGGTCIPDIAARLFGSENVWLLYEQIWFKDGNTRRTPWHQDLPYLPVEGEDLCVIWTNLDPVSKEASLEFVQGSHRGPLFNPSAFNPEDESAALFEKGVLPPLPDIEATRDQWPIVSWATKPGDVVVFHPAMLHGGAPTRAGLPRRTLSLRFFGDQAFCAARPHGGLADVEGLKHDDGGRHPLKKMAAVAPGTLFRHPDFPKLRP